MAGLSAQRPPRRPGRRGAADLPGASIHQIATQARRVVAVFLAFSPAARHFLAFSILISIAFAIFNLVFNLYMSALGFSNDIIGVFNSLPALALLGVGLPLAAMADRIGYRLFLLGSGSLAVIGSLVLSIAGGRLVAVLAAGTFALALSVLAVLSGPLLAQISRETERVSLFAVNQFGGGIPEAAARATRLSSASPGSIRSAFVVMTLLTVLGLPFLLRLAKEAGLRPTVVMPVRDLLRVDTRRFTRILLPGFVLGIGAGMYLNFLQLYLLQRFGLTPGPIGLILAVGAALTALVTLLAPRVARRTGLSRSVGLLQAAGSPLVLGLAFIMTLPLAVVIIYLRQLALNLQAPLSQVFGMEYVEPQQRARLATAQTVVTGIGLGGLGPLLSGFLQVRGGYQLAFSVSAGFYMLAGLTFLVMFGRLRLPSERAAAG
ncbi:MAG: MFS transporter [Chloroflexi bacterium]|nr:MAG: MFS transporter [Chloroflexota bacterium]